VAIAVLVVAITVVVIAAANYVTAVVVIGAHR